MKMTNLVLIWFQKSKENSSTFVKKITAQELLLQLELAATYEVQLKNYNLITGNYSR